MHSIGFMMKLKPGCQEEYKRRHDNLWPEMHAALRQHGINMAIFRREDELFVHVWVPSEESWIRLGKHPVAARWDAHMTDILEKDAQGGIQFNYIPLVFSVGQFAE
jgi:L-rhamnose mutarotase